MFWNIKTILYNFCLSSHSSSIHLGKGISIKAPYRYLYFCRLRPPKAPLWMRKHTHAHYKYSLGF